MEVSNGSMLPCGSTLNQSTKNFQMREFIEAVNEYLNIRTENSALIIKKILQAYSVTIDMSIFDPDLSLGSQFYVSLYELFTKLEPQSQMAWSCIDLLINACRNCAARQALINTYQFVPTLSRLLSDQLSTTKKKKLLRLMQDLTCGIKLSWQIPHLPHLLKTLTKWVEDKDQEIVCLSLGVLVNICYKNLPAIYTLSRIVDSKKFLRYCLPLQGPLVEVHVCKLMIIVDHSHENIPKKTLLNLIEPTFLSILESLTKNDPVMLRLVVDFFVEMVLENSEVLKEYQHYNEQLCRLIQLINARNTSSDPESVTLAQHDPECVTLILKFIYTLETNQLGNLSSLYPKIVKLALTWVHSKRVSYQAFTLLTLVTQNAIKIDDGSGDKNILQMLVSKLPEFLLTLSSESVPATMEECKRLGSLLQLLRTMLKSSSISSEVLQNMDEKILHKIFSHVFSGDLNLTDLPKIRVNENSTTSTDVIDTYVYALGLVNELSQHNAGWLESLSTLMENSTIHSILAHALYGSEHTVKQLVLEMSKYPRFPMHKVAIAMENIQNMFCSNIRPVDRVANPLSKDLSYPILSVAQMEILDETLTKFKRLVDEHDPSNIPTKQVMELYEYKITSLAHSERTALNSIEAASERCIHLQHRLAQLTAEQNKLRQVMYQSQMRLDETVKALEGMQKAYLETKKEADCEIAKYEKYIAETEARIKDTKSKLLEMTEQKNSFEQQYTKCKEVIQRLEENGRRTEKQLQKREEQLKNANLHIDTINLQNQDMQKMLSQKEAKLTEVTKQYVASKEIINTITKVANSQLP